MAPAAKFSPKEQEEIILNAAIECIESTSLLDFTMSSVAKTAGLSMGSIYKHVQCKEDIIFALAHRVYSNLCNIFKQVLALELTTPEKIMAITLLNPKKTELYSFSSHLESFAANELVINKASQMWTERMLSSSGECEQVFYTCMHNAALSGELSLDGDVEHTIEEINLSCWALTVGYQHVERVIQIRQIADGTDSLKEPVATNAHIVNSLMRLLNSYQWQTPITQAGVEKVARKLTECELR